MISWKKATPVELHDGSVVEFDHYIFTLGTERCGLRITRGNLSRHGKWHSNCPCVFLLWKGKRVG